MKEKKGRNLIIIIAAVVVVAVGGIIFLLLNREAGYRVIKVFSLDGSAVITRVQLGEIEAYENMLLESGDVVALDTGTMTLKLDEDKYIYVEEQTEFELQASGSSENSKTTIRLNRGAITNELQNKLNGESVYEVNTQNSTMSVRGTKYRVVVYTDEQGVVYTRISVFEGSVVVRLIYPDGTIAEDETVIDKGKEIIIYDDGTVTDYLTDVRDIDYDGLLDNSMETIQNSGDSVTVTFLYEGSVFGTQQVKKGDCAAEPVLMPAPDGSWNFDFDTPITEDTEIIFY